MILDYDHDIRGEIAEPFVTVRKQIINTFMVIMNENNLHTICILILTTNMDRVLKALPCGELEYVEDLSMLTANYIRNITITKAVI